MSYLSLSIGICKNPHWRINPQTIIKLSSKIKKFAEVFKFEILNRLNILHIFIIIKYN
jgi:hypothetical protein